MSRPTREGRALAGMTVDGRLEDEVLMVAINPAAGL
jgi:hypothetical protein